MLEYLKRQKEIGRKRYVGKGFGGLKDKKREVVHLVRSAINRSYVEGVESFFKSYSPLPALIDQHDCLYEVVNRTFLYKNSTAKTRAEELIAHFEGIEKFFTRETLEKMYLCPTRKGVELWRGEDLDMSARLSFIPGQHKEGLLTLTLDAEGARLYHINFMFVKDGSEGYALRIGTLQGSPEGLSVSKKVTKKMYGYRPKNLIVYILRILSETLKLTKILAVSDEGFFSQSHLIRGNRCKQTQFNSFWEELNGQPLAGDSRFFELPIEEARKTYETAKTHKRNLYRNRYALLDQYKAEVEENIRKMMN